MALSRRQEYSLNDWGPAPDWFHHTEKPGKPATPTMPDGLSVGDQADVNAFIAAKEGGATFDKSAAELSTPAKNKITEFNTYYASMAYLCWKADDNMARDSQWRIRRADVHDAVETAGVVPKSADATGAGDAGDMPSTPFPESAL